MQQPRSVVFSQANQDKVEIDGKSTNFNES